MKPINFFSWIEPRQAAKVEKIMQNNSKSLPQYGKILKKEAGYDMSCYLVYASLWCYQSSI